MGIIYRGEARRSKAKQGEARRSRAERGEAVVYYNIEANALRRKKRNGRETMMTRQRELVLRIIHNSDEHLSAQEIFFEAKALLPSISMATVYNSLQYLCEAKLIRKLSVEGGVDKYDKSCVPHAHLVCRECKRLSDVDSGGLGEVLSSFLKIDALSYSLNVEYVCDDCRERTA